MAKTKSGEKAKVHSQNAVNEAGLAASDAKQAALEKLEQMQESELRAALKEKAAAGKGKAAAGAAQARENVEGVKQTAAGKLSEAQEKASAGKDRVAAGAAQARDAADGIRQTAAGKISEAQDQVQDARNRAIAQADAAKAKAGELEIRAQQKAREAKTWLDTFIGTPFSLRRTYVAYGVAFWTSSVVRMACLSPVLPIFGKHLSETLAPIERDDVSWLYIALTKAIDLALAVWVYQSESTKVEAPLLGIVLTLIGRPTLYQFFHHHFLLSTKTVSEVLITDAAAGAAALAVIGMLLPSPPTFRPPPIASIKRNLNIGSFQTIAQSLGLGVLLSALIEFVSDRTFLHQVMKAGLLEHSIPSYFAANRPASAFALAHPLLAIPTLRTSFDPLSMFDAITRSLPFTFAFIFLALFVIPQLSTGRLSTIVFLLTTPAAFLTLWNLLPLTAWSCGIAAAVMGARQALVASVMSWLLADLRRPVESKGISTHVEVTTSRIVGRELDGSRLVETEVSEEDI